MNVFVRASAWVMYICARMCVCTRACMCVCVCVFKHLYKYVYSCIYIYIYRVIEGKPNQTAAKANRLNLIANHELKN